MKNYLPSKKFVITISVFLFLSIIFLIISNSFSGKVVFSQDKKNVNNSLSSNEEDLLKLFSSIDSDGDGVFDWEEALWGTNPFMKSSFGDDVSDKYYIENKKRQMQDKYDDLSKNEEPPTETEIFAKQFYTVVSTINQSGSLDRSGVENFSKEINKAFYSYTINNKYKISDLRLATTPVIDYYKQLQEAYISSGSSKIKKQEFEIIADYFSKKDDPIALENLNNLMVFYSQFSKTISTMKVPHQISGSHLALMNSTEKISKSLEILKSIHSDPIRVISGLTEYKKSSEQMKTAIDSINTYFIQNDIMY